MQRLTLVLVPLLMLNKAKLHMVVLLPDVLFTVLLLLKLMLLHS